MPTEDTDYLKQTFKEMEEKRFTPYDLAFGVVCACCIFEKNVKGGFCSQFDPPKYVFSIPPNQCPKMKHRVYFETDKELNKERVYNGKRKI